MHVGTLTLVRRCGELNIAMYRNLKRRQTILRNVRKRNNSDNTDNSEIKASNCPLCWYEIGRVKKHRRRVCGMHNPCQALRAITIDALLVIWTKVTSMLVWYIVCFHNTLRTFTFTMSMSDTTSIQTKYINVHCCIIETMKTLKILKTGTKVVLYSIALYFNDRNTHLYVAVQIAT